MPLTRVSLTGPDDRTAVEQLVQLAHRYPFVEWAVLYSPAREGMSRYPSRAWRKNFEDAVSRSYPPIHRALHVCGKGVEMFARQGPASVDCVNYQRVQLNVNCARWDPLDVKELLKTADVAQRWDGQPQHIIVQHNKNNAAFLNGLRDNVDVLYDSSGGFGKLLTDVLGPWPGHYTGYAGGLGPDNVVQMYKRIESINHKDFWMDMESGIRTDDVFDLEKAERVLKLLEPFVARR